MKGKYLILATVVVFFLSGVCANSNFDVSSTLLKESLSGSDFASKNLEVADGVAGRFSLMAVSVPGISFSEEEFILKQGERRNVDVYFNSTGIAPGVYVGNVQVDGPVDTLTVPLVFEVESEDVFFDANLDIPPVYTEIEKGTKMVYQIKLFDLTAGGGLQEGLGPVSVDVEFSVTSLEGSVLISQEEQFVVNKQSQVTNTITFPEEIKAGTYVLSAVVKYKSSTGTSSQLFSIVDKTSDAGIDLKFDDYGLLIIAGIILLIFLGMIFLFVYLLKERDKILVELKKYNSSEIKQVKELLMAQQKVLRNRNVRSDRVEEEVNQKLDRLQKKQAERVSKMKSLKKSGNVEEMKKKLAQWKSEGYVSAPLDYKVKELSTRDMQKVLKKWREKYIKIEKPKVIKRKKTKFKKR